MLHLQIPLCFLRGDHFFCLTGLNVLEPGGGLAVGAVACDEKRVDDASEAPAMEREMRWACIFSRNSGSLPGWAM